MRGDQRTWPGALSGGAVLLLTAALASAPTACSDRRSRTADVQRGDLDTLDERATYALGYDLGRNLREQQVEVDPEHLLRGILDGLEERRPLLTDAEIHDTLTEFRESLSRRSRERSVERARQNRERCAEVLADNRRRPGVTETASGLQYEILEEGTGRRPGPGDEVSVHYEGTLPDGTIFNTTYPVGNPARMQVDGVISGWSEALRLMREGARWRILLPAELAYGDDPPTPEIGPAACLIFEIELLEVVER